MVCKGTALPSMYLLFLSSTRLLQQFRTTAGDIMQQVILFRVRQFWHSVGEIRFYIMWFWTLQIATFNWSTQNEQICMDFYFLLEISETIISAYRPPHVLNITEMWPAFRIREVWVSDTGYENDTVWFCFGFAQIPSQKQSGNIYDPSKHSEYPSWHTFTAFVVPFLILCGFRKRQNMAQCGLKASQASRTLDYTALHTYSHITL
jgi:hypothetical protein